MGLFGNRKDTTTETPSDTTTAPAPAPNNPADLAAAIVQAMVSAGIVGGGQTQQTQTPTQPADDVDPPDPRVVSAAQQAADQRIASMMPYAEAFETAVPSLVRSQVVQTLTQGQQLIYNKYKHEVDDTLNRNLRGNPEALVNPDTHRRAIEMILGRHSDEIETLSLQNATAADVPHLVPPSSNTTPTTPEPQLSENDRTFVQQFSFGSRNPNEWTPQTYDYYKNMPKGYLHEMVARHKQHVAETQPPTQS